MRRTAVAIVTGSTKHRALCEMSFAPLLVLKSRGVLDRIIYVTWGSPWIEGFVDMAADTPEVELLRLPPPKVSGSPLRREFTHLNRNLAAALSLVPDPNTLIVKLRPDFVFDQDFLTDKIQYFDALCAPSEFAGRLGVRMPPSVFSSKIWIPWADANQPFFFADEAFIGLRRDVEKLVSKPSERQVDVLGDGSSGWIAQVLRYATPFFADYPIFERYLHEFHRFSQDLQYRRAVLPVLLGDPFFLSLIIANAWILASNFHVDCGKSGDLAFYPQSIVGEGDIPLSGMNAASPYNAVEVWREHQNPGSLAPCISRVYGRLVDDAWQRLLFSGPVLADVTLRQIGDALRLIGSYRDGTLKEFEDEFTRKLTTLYNTHRLGRAA